MTFLPSPVHVPALRCPARGAAGRSAAAGSGVGLSGLSLLVLLCVGCDSKGSAGGGNTQTPVVDGDPAPGSGVMSPESGSTAPGAGTGADAGSQVTPPSGLPDMGMMGEGGDGVLRFVAMGDTGEGNEGQYAVGRAIEQVCAELGCDLVILLGDNFYDDGVASVDDPQWQSKFEEPYAGIDLPFYAVLGNHDYGGELPLLGSAGLGGLGNQFEKGPIEVAYTDVSEKWTMPATFYTFQLGPVGFVAMDTNAMMFDNTDNGDQSAWYPGAVAELAGSDWIVGLGHHPYLSNGQHGNAGDYDGLELAGQTVTLPIVAGEGVKEFFDAHVCGSVDVYLSGHDHLRAWLDEPEALCGATLIVSGAGAKLRSIVERGNRTLFQDDTREGFLHATVDGDSFVGRFFDRDGLLDFEHMVVR